MYIFLKCDEYIYFFIMEENSNIDYYRIKQI